MARIVSGGFSELFVCQIWKRQIMILCLLAFIDRADSCCKMPTVSIYKLVKLLRLYNGSPPPYNKGMLQISFPEVSLKRHD